MTICVGTVSAHTPSIWILTNNIINTDFFFNKGILNYNILDKFIIINIL